MNLHDRLRLEISPDSMQASLFPVTDYPNRTVRVKHVRSFLDSHGVHYGVQEKSIEALLKAWRAGSVQRPVLIARGSAPREATEGGVRRVAPPPRDGRDPVELLPLFVRKGERVIAVDPPQEAAPGRSVRGEIIPAPPGLRPLSLEPGEGLRVKESSWFATRTGFLVEAVWVNIGFKVMW